MKNPVEKVQETNCFFIPDNALCSELHLAAFLDVPRRTVVDTLIHPDGQNGIPYVAVGNRKVFATDAALEAIRRMASPQPRPRRKGGAKRCQGDQEA